MNRTWYLNENVIFSKSKNFNKTKYYKSIFLQVLLLFCTKNVVRFSVISETKNRKKKIQLKNYVIINFLLTSKCVWKPFLKLHFRELLQKKNHVIKSTSGKYRHIFWKVLLLSKGILFAKLYLDNFLRAYHNLQI